MQRTIPGLAALFIFTTVAVFAAAQATAPAQQPATQSPAVPRSQIQYPDQTVPPKPPDMVCFGYGPKWSIQFTNGEAHYLGINQPDQTLLGDFYWVPQEKAWEWHRANDLAPMNGSFDLSATIQKQSCSDPVRRQTYPYSAQVNLPQGDMVSGCCRKLRPGEAAVGRHGLQQTAPAPYGSAPTTQGGTQPGASQGTSPSGASQGTSQQGTSTNPSPQ
jgi:uncharacterized membrane protein